MNHIELASINLSGAISFLGEQPLDAKLLVDTKADLKAVTESSDYSEGAIVFCKEDKTYYQFSASHSEADTKFFKKLYLSTEAPVPASSGSNYELGFTSTDTKKIPVVQEGNKLYVDATALADLLSVEEIKVMTEAEYNQAVTGGTLPQTVKAVLISE